MAVDFGDDHGFRDDFRCGPPQHQMLDALAGPILPSRDDFIRHWFSSAQEAFRQVLVTSDLPGMTEQIPPYSGVPFSAVQGQRR
jgi:hypothetical protein